MRIKENELKINSRLASDFYLLRDMGYEVLGVFLQGSQNYDLDYEGSDIDTKAIVLPTLEQIILNKKPVSTTHVLPSNEHVDIKDIRLMFDCFKKQNVNFLEILFTDNMYLNPEYASLYKPMINNRESIAHYNKLKAVMTMVGMALEKQKALCHRYEGLVDKIDKYGYDSKQLHHIVRLEEFVRRYISGESYESCLISKDPEYLIKIKSDNAFYNKDQAVDLADKMVEKIRTYEEDFKKIPVFVDNTVEELMNRVLYDTIKKAILKNIGG